MRETAFTNLFPAFSIEDERMIHKDRIPKYIKYTGGVPLSYDREGKRIAVDVFDTHTLVYGSTGSYKTRAVCLPTIKMIGYAGESMIINDSKGELHDRLAGWLRSKGYKIININFRDPKVGNRWNPLAVPFACYKAGDVDKAAEYANDIANNLSATDRSTEEPFWDNAASDTIFGLMMLLFKYCSEHNIAKERVNISSLLAMKRYLFNSVNENGWSVKPQNLSLWKYAAEDELIYASLSNAVYTAEATRQGILSVFDSKMRIFAVSNSLLDMMADSDFDLGDLEKEKCAVFLVTPDEKTSYHRLVSIFIKQSYEYLIDLASKNDSGRLGNRVNFILDEFSSLPPISDMPAMISAARSRDIRFLLIVQSKSSLKKRYGDEAETIVSNCNNWIFLTSRELPLLNEISELCGESGKNRIRNITPFDLQHLDKEKHRAIIISGRQEPVEVSLIDIDQFGKKSYEIEGYKTHPPLCPEPLTFKLSDELEEKYSPQKTNSTTSSLFGQQVVPPPTPPESPAASVKKDDKQKADKAAELAQRIDDRIKKLEEKPSATAGNED